jgi:pimeloyl-ACP methyl ester carboxylesterase
MRRPVSPLHAATLAVALVLAACTTDQRGAALTTVTDPSVAPAATAATPSDHAGGPSTAPPTPGHIQWTNLGNTGRLQTGNLVVPLDYQNPSKGTVDLYLVRHLAVPKQRIGSLLVNPGGPGFPGSDFALDAEGIYTTTLTSRFDIVGWDPRGTGQSTPTIDCISDYDHFYAGTDITPDTTAERQRLIDLAKEFADDCVKKNGTFMSYMGTNNSARDMDSIRQALGEQKISYFGSSYGSELGATWATLFPSTVRAAVFDGAVDPTVDLTTSGVQQDAGFEQAFTTFLADCSRTSKCPFRNGGHADEAFDTLMSKLDEHPLPTEQGRPDLTRGMALTGVADAMYLPSLWPKLQLALDDAQRGDGTALLHLYDDYYQRRSDGTYDNSLEAFQVITCEDHPERPTVAQDDATAPRYQQVAPRFAPNTTGSYTCTFFPPSIDPMVKVTAKGAGPILVMGTTGDPATPLVGTRVMASTLEDGRLVVVKAEGHTGYSANGCSRKVVDNYLLDPVGKAPKNETRC